MAYITIQDIQNYIDQINLNACFQDFGQGSMDSNAIQILNNILQVSSDKADALVSSIYSTPFSNPVPVKIRTAASVFAAEICYQRRLVPGEKNPMTPQADHWRQELMDINRGLLSLDFNSQRSFIPTIPITVPNRANVNFF